LNKFSDNAYVTILLCSSIDAKKNGYKPYTPVKWNELVKKIMKSPLKEPAELLNTEKSRLPELLRIDTAETERITKLLSRGANLALKLDEFERMGINVITKSDKEYPLRLKKILKRYAPPVLYYSGDISLAARTGIAIVGSRNIDKTGERVASTLAEKAVDEGLLVFSGGARGVDVISEKSALKKGGRVVSFLANSLEKKIRKKDDRNLISKGRLLLMSSANPDAPFSTGAAMGRNKYVYALSTGTFVVASSFKKGGTWAGATDNLKNQRVKLFVYDSEQYTGNKALIKRGATPFDQVDSLAIIDLLKGEQLQKSQINLFETRYADQQHQKNYDLYYVVIDTILDFVQEKKSLKEIKEALKVSQNQASFWLKRAIEDRLIEKTYKPVKYRAIKKSTPSHN